MALKIRLRRMGRKKAPTYRIVVAESSMPRDGRFVANIGHYNPRTEPMTLVVDRDKAHAWMAKGAMPTETVEALFKRANVYGEAPAEGVVEAVQEAASKAAGAVKGAAKKAAAAVSGAAAAVTGAAGDAAESVRDAAAGAAETVTETTTDVIEAAADTASEVAETATDTASDAVAAVSGDEATEERAAE